MTPEGILPTCAEISVALLGFAAIASVFRGGRGVWAPDGRFWNMLALAALTVGGALFPLPLLSASVESSTVWGTSSAVLGIGAASLLWFALRGTHLDRAAGVPTNWWLGVPWFALIGGAAVLALLNCGMVAAAQFWPYLAALLSLQFATVLAFIRILVVWLPRA